MLRAQAPHSESDTRRLGKSLAATAAKALRHLAAKRALSKQHAVEFFFHFLRETLELMARIRPLSLCQFKPNRTSLRAMALMRAALLKEVLS